MNFTQAKKPSEVILVGAISVEFDKTDETLNAVIFKDAYGHICRVANRSYSMYVEIPAPPQMEKKWQLSGTYKKIEIKELFDDKWNAEARRNELSDDLLIEEVSVPVSEE